MGLKFFNVYGPNEEHKGPMKSVAAQIWPDVRAARRCSCSESTARTIADGGQMRDFVYVRDCADVVAWLLDNPRGQRASSTWAPGRRAASRTWPRRCSPPPASPPQIDYIAMPPAIRDKYQYFTEAQAWIACAPPATRRPVHRLEDGIGDYVGGYLSQPDPYR